MDEPAGEPADGNPPGSGGGDLLHGPAADWLESAKEALEAETGRWAALENVPPVAAPSREPETDAHRLDEELRRLGAMRERWDELVGHLSMLLKMLGLWRELGFASFSHYSTERLGMAARTVAQRAWLERRLHELPALRQAMREGRVSYEKARLVAGSAAGAGDASVNAWITQAEKATCIDLRRKMERSEDAKTCARGELDLRLPQSVAILLGLALRAAREAAGRWLSPGECLEQVAQHFIDTWKAALPKRKAPQRRVLDRDRGYCQVPGCSRGAAHAHHVRFRSRGGGDEESNLVSVCAIHHLRGIHMGLIRVYGQAPDRLVWELGLRPDGSPFAVVEASM